MKTVFEGLLSTCPPGMGHEPPASSPEASVGAFFSRDVAFTLDGTVPHRPWPTMGAMMRSKARCPPALLAPSGMLPWKRFAARLRCSRLTRSEEFPANHCGGMVPAGLQQQSVLRRPQHCRSINPHLQRLSFHLRHRIASYTQACHVPSDAFF